MSRAKDEGSRERSKFGTFGGVFTPNVLTILGVIMFLRFGQITGQAGIGHAILILLCAKLITSLTSFSLAAIATNTRVKGGGAYYLISRSLGVEFGGGIAFVFYLAQSVSVAMYVIGFAEAFVAAYPGIASDQRLVASIANATILVTVLIGAGWAIRLQYVILLILAAAIASFALGAGALFSIDRLTTNFVPAYTGGASALTMFALFFPAATGIMAGANMSGDLRDPAKSLPIGTFAAIGVTGLVYLSLILLLAGSVDRQELISNSLIMNDVAFWPVLIIAGVFAATLSSALGSMLGAPRIMQAFARDRVFTSLRFLGRGSGAADEPRRATIITALVSQAAILLGDLNAIAPIITMFFMVTYGTLNLACFYESYSGNPSFRPRFRYSHWTLALLGTIGCLIAMLLIDALWAVVSLIAMAALYWAIRRIGIEARWGDVHSGMAFERARKALLSLESEPIHPKNWRPIILALGAVSTSRRRIAEYGQWLTAGRGVLSLGQVVGEGAEDRLERGYQVERLIRQTISEEALEAFPAVVVDEDLLGGLKSLLQCHGIGGVRPNTVLLGWSNDIDEIERFSNILRLSEGLQRNIVVLKSEIELEPWEAPSGEIHIWWHGRRNGPLMLLLAHLLTQNDEFRRRKTRLIHVIPEEAGRDQARAHLVQMTERARIEVEPMIVVSENLREALLNISQNAAVVFKGFDPPAKGEHIQFFQDFEVLTEGLSEVILVSSAQGVDLEA
ncbi:MAG: amino acid permease [Gammaproteobacteria bacterium]|nr:amino acid permease [Gammaproteobacteria bacterium]